MQPGTGQRCAAPAVIIHCAAEARLARALAGPAGVTLLSAPGAAGFLGAAWWLALLRAAEAEPCGVLDCDRAPGLALAALRAGVRRLLLLPGAPGRATVALAAAELGAELIAERPRALDLRGLDLAKTGGREKLAGWLGGPGDTRGKLR